MNALDAGWAMLKMPLVPGSLRQNTEDNWEAKFRDPETDEIMPVDVNVARHNPFDYISAIIGPRRDKHTDIRASAQAKGHFIDEADPDEPGMFVMDSAKTEEDYRRRGYMAALHDTVAAVADRGGNGGSVLMPSDTFTPAGIRFWESLLGEGAADIHHTIDLDDGKRVHVATFRDAIWPVRDDL